VTIIVTNRIALLAHWSVRFYAKYSAGFCQSFFDAWFYSFGRIFWTIPMLSTFRSNKRNVGAGVPEFFMYR